MIADNAFDNKTNTPSNKEKKQCIKFQKISTIVYNNFVFLCSHIHAKMQDDLLLGTEHQKKIIPGCKTPSPLRTETDEHLLSVEEKKAIIIDDPKFGMFSLFKYHLKKGHKNDVLKQKNTMYCSHIFSSLTALPILIFIAQWTIWIAIIADQNAQFDGELCPNKAPWTHKLLMFSISLIYFVKSFFLWDNLTDRTKLNRMTPSIDSWVLIDTLQEYGFNLLVYGANLWIIYVTDDPLDMVMNSLAMEFVMNFDNEFETMYFDNLPEVAEEIYDDEFVTYRDNMMMLNNKSKCFNIMRYVVYMPFKILVISLFLFPIFCAWVAIVAPICK